MQSDNALSHNGANPWNLLGIPVGKPVIANQPGRRLDTRDHPPLDRPAAISPGGCPGFSILPAPHPSASGGNDATGVFRANPTRRARWGRGRR